MLLPRHRIPSTRIVETMAVTAVLILATWSFAELPDLRVRANNPHLIEDENGNPFFMAGYCPQNILNKLTYRQMDAYFADREARKMNFAWVHLTCWGLVDHYGHSFFINGSSTDGSLEPSNMNPAFDASVDSLVTIAERHNCYLFLNVTNEYNQLNLGGHTLTECRHFGQFWGGRYKNRKNVHWAFGNDGYDQSKDNQVALGIKDSMPNQLMCIDWTGGQPYDSYIQGNTWINVWGWYAYGDPIGNTAREYKRSPVKPTFIFESGYENENLYGSAGDAQMIRQQMYTTVLGGGSGFGIYGDNHWEDCVLEDLPGVMDVPNCVNFFTARKWYDLVPDANHTFMTSSGPNLTAALTTDRTFGTCYYMGSSGGNYAITIDMSKMAGSTTARWYDGSDGNYTAITGSPFINAGSHVFTTPGNNGDGKTDWLLVLETTGASIIKNSYSVQKVKSLTSAHPYVHQSRGKADLPAVRNNKASGALYDMSGRTIAGKASGVYITKSVR